jgi:NAD(P)-dependent dehydrogenase (short-subunit alcohol dehydrogenase family)
MQKTILVTGSTDGIGLETAKMLASMGHHVLLHGRNPAKLEEAERKVSEEANDGNVESYVADLSRMSDVDTLAKAVTVKHTQLDVLINNAGIFKTSEHITQEGLDVRYAVNTIAPYLLTQELLPLLGSTGRVINLSSAAQAPVDVDALAGRIKLDDMSAYAQSKLALTMWSNHMAHTLKDQGPVFVAVNPGSLLATKMVKEGFGMAGKDIRIGADILIRAALSDEFETANGRYFDNDVGQFASPHLDALDAQICEGVVQGIEAVLAEITR